MSLRTSQGNGSAELRDKLQATVFKSLEARKWNEEERRLLKTIDM
jgi:hypothetical protein